MHRGIDWLNGNSQAALEEAVRCFDEAIALRRDLPREVAANRYALAAGWVNRADALARLDADRLREALAAYDEALALLRDLPLEENPLFPRRLAIAWINRGLAMHQDPAEMARGETVRCFRAALETLDGPGAAAIPDLRLLRAGALANLAATLVEMPGSSPVEAQRAAEDAMALVRDDERTDPRAAEMGVKARHAWCRAFAAALPSGEPPALPELGRADAMLREGLALAAWGEARGAGDWRPLAEDLFHFGCRLHRSGPPERLAAFIVETLERENAAANREMLDIATVALRNGLMEIQRSASFSAPGFAPLLAGLQSLRAAEERVAAWRRADGGLIIKSSSFGK